MPACAQYTDQKAERKQTNRPLSEFVHQQKVLWNFDWELNWGVGAYRIRPWTSPSDQGRKEWRHVDLPHDFQFEQPWTQDGGGARGFKPMCEGWYRKTFVADKSWQGLNVKLDFGGIIYLGDVYVNGEKVASSDYTDELFAGISTKKMLGGRMQVIVRSKREAGKVEVRASTPKLKAIYKTISK